MASLVPRTFRPFRLALCQIAGSADKQRNLDTARRAVLDGAARGANVVVLPECFNSPYGTQYFSKYAETTSPGSTSYDALQAMAKDAHVYLIGGSIPEREGDRLYNTSLSFSPTGELLGKHRKLHLFDIDVPGKIRFQESEVLTGGDRVTMIDTEYGRLGVAICYDVRFPELAMLAARNDCCAMIYPGAFNLHTGPLHWQLLARARAVDNQIYVAMCSPARDMTATYHSYGHSLVADPNAIVLDELDEHEGLVVVDLDPEQMQAARAGIPVVTQRRFDVYTPVKMVE